jgi:hypothetical protein
LRSFLPDVAPVKPPFTLDPREVDEFVAKLDPRRELVYRLAIRGLCFQEDRFGGPPFFACKTASQKHGR